MKIIGHRKVLKKINHILDAGAVGHAYLFVGPAHVGKTTIAHAFASALVSGEVMCGELLTHPDIHIVRPEKVVAKSGSVRTKDIGVDVARALIEEAARTPLSGARRVIIITESDRLTHAAQNALLKTLEEPAQRTVIIMTAVREGRLLATIRSRMGRIALMPVDDAIMEDIAMSFFDGEEDRVTARSVAHGCPGIMMACATDDDLFAWYKTMLRDALRLPEMTIAQKIAYAQQCVTDVARLQQAIIVWMHVWREQLRKSVAVDAKKWAQMLDRAQEVSATLEDTQVNPRLAIEHFLLTLTDAS